MKKERAVLELLKTYPSKSASVEKLSRELQVSKNTIRRYTLLLEKHGNIIRYHGGAILRNDAITHKDSLSTREALNISEKEKIAKEALNHIHEQEIIFIDLGSTCKRLLEKAVQIAHITIITPYLDIKNLATTIHKTTKIIIPSGTYDFMTNGVYGVFTEDFFDTIHPHVAFIGANGISDVGISINNIHEVGYKRAAIRASNKSIVLADSSKFYQKGLSVIASFEEINQIITNTFDEGKNFDKKISSSIFFV